MTGEEHDESLRPLRDNSLQAESGVAPPFFGKEEAPSANMTPIERAKYSRAFENMVRSGDDIVGLLAYAIYKESVREEARFGAKLDGSSRNPTPTLAKAFRSDAEKRIADVIGRAIEEATPDIEQNAIAAAIENLGSEVKSHIDDRTSFKASLLVNIMAWLVTIAIAAIVIFLFGKPDISGVAAEKMSGASARHQAEKYKLD